MAGHHRCLHTRRTRISTCLRAWEGDGSSGTVGSSCVWKLAKHTPCSDFGEVEALAVELVGVDLQLVHCEREAAEVVRRCASVGHGEAASSECWQIGRAHV